MSRRQQPRRAGQAVGSMLALGYVRVSTEEQVEGVSLGAQESRVRAYAAAHGLELRGVIVDDGVSAGVPLAERNGGGELQRVVGCGEVHHVVAVKLDRLFRDAVECLETVRGWEEAAVSFHVLELGGQSVNTRTAFGKFFLTVMAAAAELELNRIRERTRDALHYKRQRGERLGTTPYGFLTPEPGAPMVPVAAEMETVRYIIRRRRAGTSYRVIAAELNAKGIPPKRGEAWGDTSVRSIYVRRDRYRAFLEVAAEPPRGARGES